MFEECDVFPEHDVFKYYDVLVWNTFLKVPPVGVFQNLDDWTFDVFALNQIGEGHALKYVGYELLQRYDLINKFKVSSTSILTCLKRKNLNKLIA